jgi:hypothetical protein
MAQDSGADEAFRIWLDSQPKGPGQLGFKGAVVKQGPQVLKTVVVAEYGDQATGEVRKRELRVRTFPRSIDTAGYDFDNPSHTWHCENDEVDRLLAFVSSEVSEAGRYRLIDTASPTAALLDWVTAIDVDTLASSPDLPALIARLATTDAGRRAAENAVLTDRRNLVERLKQMARDPATTETDMQNVIGSAYWLFGGRYVGVADRRNLVPLDQHDIPLLGADGTLHVVELKGPVVPRLVRRHRNHPIVGEPVHEAVSQAVNYLRGLDELGAGLQVTHQNAFGTTYDLVRVFATVVIGHPTHVADFDQHQIDQTIRTYNAHLSRVEVVTYESLLAAAERALAFEQARADGDDGTTSAEPQDEPWPSTKAPFDPWGDEPPF